MTQFHDTISTRLALIFAGVAPVSFKREEGQTLAEYAMILALIAVLVAVSLTFLKDQINSLFTAIGNQL